MDQDKGEILKQTVIEEEKPKASLAEKLKAENKKKLKKKIILTSVVIFSAFIAYGVHWLFKPYMAPPDYGICRTFIELNISYPETLEVSQFSYGRDGGLRLWFTHIDAFGEYRMEQFRCWFEYNEYGQVSKVKALKKGRVNLDPDIVAHLNSSLPYFHANPVILAWPYIPDSLTGVMFETHLFRKIQFDPKR